MSAPTRFHQPAVRPSQPHPARPPQPVRPRRRWLPYALAGGFGMVLLLALACVFAVVLAFVSADRIPERVTVAGVNIGGESAQKAEMRLEQVFADKTIQLTGGERTQTLSLTDLGISVDLEATLAAAQQAVPGQAVNPAYEVDLGQAQTALVTLSQVVNVEPLGGDAPRNGRSIDIPVLLD
ncbi:MAG: hypothetical protein K8J31_06780, partial [Anaerolineae bacterium]|nr:hypothetical protein [Anaerolineae bacterium]